MATPIFVVGRNRSGTTWLANQLCEHPDIVGVQHERHHGIHESAFFGRIDGRYGDLSERINYAEFVEVVSASDFFSLAGATREFLYSLWPTTYEEVFRKVMDRFAEAKGAATWVEESDVQVGPLRKAIAAYPDARFVAILRDVVANTASTIANPKAQAGIRNRTWALIRMALGWVYTTKILRVTSRQSERVMLVSYEDLQRDTDGALRAILAFIGLASDPAVLNQTYQPQSTFRSAADRERALSKSEERLIRGAAAIARPSHGRSSAWVTPSGSCGAVEARCRSGSSGCRRSSRMIPRSTTLPSDTLEARSRRRAHEMAHHGWLRLHWCQSGEEVDHQRGPRSRAR